MNDAQPGDTTHPAASSPAQGGPAIHSFIIKIWVEEKCAGERRAWHGLMTHIPGGERRHVRRLSEIVAFIREYLPRRSWLRRLLPGGRAC